MAARINRHHTEQVREKIQASVIVDRLHRHHMGELELTATQIKAGTELLDRAVPKLSQVQTDVNVEGEISITHKIG